MANRFWVGGSGTWDGSSTANWSTSTGGASGASVPGSADTAIFDSNSGSPTVTVNTTVSITGITQSAASTLDFSVNNNNVNLSGAFNQTAGTVKMGNGTWTISIVGNTSPFTAVASGITANSSSLVFTGASSNATTFATAGNTFNNVTINANSSRGIFRISGSPTLASLTVNGPNRLVPNSAITITTTSLTIAGTQLAPILMENNVRGTAFTLSQASGSPSIAWAGITDTTFSGGATFTASNSLDLGGNTGITIASPCLCAVAPALAGFASAEW